MTNIFLILVAAIIIGIIIVILQRRWEKKSSSRQMMPPSSFPTTIANDSASYLAGDSELQRFLAQGQKIEAIKWVRELTDMSLQEAKDYVEALAYGEPLPAPSSTPVKSASSVEVEQEARRLLADRNKIEAIKRVRELTHMSLQEAKDFVESLEDKGMRNL